ncbi:cell division protein ZapE [Rheinheimera riviphila]|uniref:Cell division protein ZapE n=1 Tax=Rheinheimera riviphila TaxID=1834037 RepID=A0A437R555_9GAMM|nr:cell division protein ZapE [Rheinheimera riviphila]RVU41863.1 cell division protein ZapE [Rheinheimera riviphila]
MLQSYQQQVESGLLRFDEAQWQVLQQLAVLAGQLDGKLDGAGESNKTGHLPPQGLYIYGPVGRGKTMLMDLFYQQLATTQKIRLHFHHFMARVHQELHQLSGQPEPLRRIAKTWAARYQILCFDEFFVTDIGDAMLLGTLWRELFALKVVLVATSNSAPADLYANGLQRSRFLPAITLLEQHCQLFALDHGVDYRRLQQHPMRFYLQQSAPGQLAELATTHFGPLQPMSKIRLLERDIPCLWRNEVIIGFDFMALCSGPRSQLDYMALASQFRAIAVTDVPQFTKVSDTAILHGVEENYQREPQDMFVSKLDNEARRFIALVDECYERQTLLLLSAEVAIAELYQASQLSFAFERTISRLHQMQSWTPVNFAR